jgi:excisionase family DNA binding protein
VDRVTPASCVASGFREQFQQRHLTHWTTRMKLTMGQAAKHLGCSKSTLSRAVKDGRISAEKREDGSYAIDASELQRYADAAVHRLMQDGVDNTHETGGLTRSSTPTATPETHVETGVLRREVELLREQIATLQGEREREREQLAEQIEDLRRRLNTEGEERRQLMALLTDQREKARKMASGGFWSRSWGKV